ncbi:unnamed protein product [Orchesella dallaii]|uniref:Uncharacterized protein n=1 Tax=Orchesella dallaii TaxID=48710 RepID=A0ABP1RP31_9HEXA
MTDTITNNDHNWGLIHISKIEGQPVREQYPAACLYFQERGQLSGLAMSGMNGLEIYKKLTRVVTSVELILVIMRLVIYAFFPPNLSKIMWSDTLVVDGATLGKPGTVNKVCHCWTWLNLIWLILAMLQTMHVLPLEMTSSSYYSSLVLASAEFRCRSLAAYVILKYKDKNWE